MGDMGQASPSGHVRCTLIESFSGEVSVIRPGFRKKFDKGIQEAKKFIDDQGWEISIFIMKGSSMLKQMMPNQWTQKEWDANEIFLNSQKPILSSMAQKENRKAKGFEGGKHSWKDYPWHRDLLFVRLFDDRRDNFVLVLFVFSKRNLLLKHL